MKKVVSMLLVLVLSSALVVSYGEDYSAMTDSELLQKLDLIYAELDARKYNDDSLMFEYEGLKIYYERAYMKGFDKTLVIEASAINEGDYRISVGADDFFINGWKVHPIVVVDLRPGQKQKLEIKIYDSDKKAEISSIQDLKEIDAIYYTYDPATNKYIVKDLEGRRIVIQ